uniref:Uncharacterized protein n=1 Tax=Parascaris equorum TaxID=6256 RepID=A0A914RKK9_PAREQ
MERKRSRLRRISVAMAESIMSSRLVWNCLKRLRNCSDRSM